MLLEKPVGDTRARPVVLDALENVPSRVESLVFQVVEVVALDDLELERDRIGRADPANEHLARLDDRAKRKRLEAVEVMPPVIVAGGRVGPDFPSVSSGLDLALGLAGRLHDDPGPDRVLDDGRNGSSSIAVVSNHVA